jgi:hypothetical protein
MVAITRPQRRFAIGFFVVGRPHENLPLCRYYAHGVLWENSEAGDVERDKWMRYRTSIVPVEKNSWPN